MTYIYIRNIKIEINYDIVINIIGVIHNLYVAGAGNDRSAFEIVYLSI